MNKILVALDGSEHSKKSVELAIDLAKNWSSEIYLIHVMERKKIPISIEGLSGERDEVPKGFEEYSKKEGFQPEFIMGLRTGINPSEYFGILCEREQFIGEAEARIKSAGIKVEVVCVEGDPADEIIKVAEMNKIDIIVMGSRGHGRFSRAIMGSVSTKVSNHSPCTVITVK